MFIEDRDGRFSFGLRQLIAVYSKTFIFFKSLPEDLFRERKREREKETLMLETSVSTLALVGLAQWLERRPADQRVPSSVPAKSMYLGCRFVPGPGWSRVGGDHLMFLSHINVSLSLFLPLALMINAKNKKSAP
uniref:Uncharacterized protein n=1 Tax=Molossus molossus TaxID=27622 RepID=A0A7J8JX40_MOLMO|nr:hypothetical protein HJG59_008062 [Molossus molossus]